MSNLQQFQANAKVFIMIDDYPSNKLNNFYELEHPKKSIYQITSFVDINTNFDVEAGGGSLTMTLNDKDKRFWKNYPIYQNLIRNFGTHEISKTNNPNSDENIEDNKITSVLYNDDEVVAFQKLLEYYANKDDSGVYKDLSTLAKDFTDEIKTTREAGGILAPAVAPQNMVWVFFLGRDGYWYSAFTGIIQSVRPNNEPRTTPTITVTARTFDRLFEYSYFVTGQLPIVPRKNIVYKFLQNQGGKSGYGSLAYVNRLSDKKFKEIIKECIETSNLFFSRYMVNSLESNTANRLGTVNIFDKVYKMESDINKKETEAKEKNVEEKTEGGELPKEKTTEDVSNEPYDYRYFKVRKIFGFGKDIDRANDAPYWGGANAEKGINLNSDEWRIKKYFWNEEIKLSDLYIGEELQDSKGNVVNSDSNFTNDKPRDLFQVKISEDFIDPAGSFVKAFQNLIRTNISLFNTDKMSIKDIFESLKKCSLAYFYCDYDGSFKIERPYFDTWLEDISMSINSKTPNEQIITPTINENGQATASPSSPITSNLSQATASPSFPNKEPNQQFSYPIYEQIPKPPADYDLRYIVSRKDISYLNDNYEETESNIITRGWIESKFNYGILEGGQSNAVIPGVQGVSESSYSTIAKYGDRQINFSPIVHENLKYLGKQQGDALMNAYALANKLLMNYKTRTITVNFDQRPDIQLNRNMIFLDLGIMFLTTKISQSYDARTSTLRTSVIGSYTRPIGSFIYNPYLYKFDFDSRSTGLLKKWTMEDLVIPKKSGTLIEGKQPPVWLEELDAVGTYNYIAQKYPQDVNYKVLCLCIRARNPNNIKDYKEWDRFKFVWKKDESKGATEDNLESVEMLGYSGSGSLNYANSNNILQNQTPLYIYLMGNSYMYLDFEKAPITIQNKTFLKLDNSKNNTSLRLGIENSNDKLVKEHIIDNYLDKQKNVPIILLGDNIIVPNYTDSTKEIDTYKFDRDISFTTLDGKVINNLNKDNMYINTLNMYLGKPDNDYDENWNKIVNAVTGKLDGKGLFMMMEDAEYVVIKKNVNNTQAKTGEENPFTQDIEELAFVASKMVRAWFKWDLIDTGTHPNSKKILPLNDYNGEGETFMGYYIYSSIGTVTLQKQLEKYYTHRQNRFELKKEYGDNEVIKDEKGQLTDMGDKPTTYRFGLPFFYKYKEIIENEWNGSNKKQKINNFSGDYFKYKSSLQLEVLKNNNWGLMVLTNQIYESYYKDLVEKLLVWRETQDNKIVGNGNRQNYNDKTYYTINPTIMKGLIYVILLSTYTTTYSSEDKRKKAVKDFINPCIEMLYYQPIKNDEKLLLIYKDYAMSNGNLTVRWNNLEKGISIEDMKVFKNQQAEKFKQSFTKNSNVYDNDYNTFLVSAILKFFDGYKADGVTLWRDINL